MVFRCIFYPSSLFPGIEAMSPIRFFHSFHHDYNSLFPSSPTFSSSVQCQYLPDTALVFSQPASSTCATSSGNGPFSRSARLSRRYFVLDVQWSPHHGAPSSTSNDGPSTATHTLLPSNHVSQQQVSEYPARQRLPRSSNALDSPFLAANSDQIGFLFHVVGVLFTVLSVRQICSRKRIVVVERYAIMSLTRKQLWLNRTMEGVVDSLAHSWSDPAIAVAQLANLRHFPRHVIADRESSEIPLFMQLIDLAQRPLKSCRLVRSMQRLHMNFLSLQRLQRAHKVLP
jgi:hypothetical protein